MIFFEVIARKKFSTVRMWKPRFAQAHACFRHQREEANKVGQFSQKQFIEMMAAILYCSAQGSLSFIYISLLTNYGFGG